MTHDCHLSEPLVFADQIRIYNSGFESIAPGDSHGLDQRNYYLIQYIAQGQGTYNIHNKKFSLYQGDVFFVFPDVPFIQRADSKKPWQLFWCGCSGTEIEDFLQKQGISLHSPVLHGQNNKQIPLIIHEMYSIMMRQPLEKYSLIGNFCLLLGELSKPNFFYRDFPVSREKTQLQKATHYIQEHINSSLKVQEVAQEACGIHSSQLYRIFMSNLNMTPQNYIMKCKIEAACTMLKKTDMSAHEIAQYLGYLYTPTFYSQFRKLTGITPTEYRKKQIP